MQFGLVSCGLIESRRNPKRKKQEEQKRWKKKTHEKGQFLQKKWSTSVLQCCWQSPGLVLRRNWRIPRWLARRWGVQYLQPKWPLFFEGQQVPQNKAEFPIKTRVIWVLGIDTYIIYRERYTLYVAIWKKFIHSSFIYPPVYLRIKLGLTLVREAEIHLWIFCIEQRCCSACYMLVCT